MSGIAQIIEKAPIRNLSQVFSDDPLQIPDFQRSYSWETKEIEDFIEDLLELYSQRDDDDKKQHFMGSVVVFKEPRKNSYPAKFTHNIVDGQQRLLTFYLLFCLLHNEFELLEACFREEKNDKFATNSRNQVNHIANLLRFKNADDEGNESLNDRLVASNTDKSLLEKVVNSFSEVTEPNKGPTSHKRIYKALQLMKYEFTSNLRGATTNEQYFRNLIKFYRCIEKECIVVYIVCPKLDSAIELFQTLNDRGKSLTDGDLIRAHCHRLVGQHEYPNKKVDLVRISELWDDILSEPAGQVKLFLEQFLYVEMGTRRSDRKLYHVYQKDIFDRLRTTNPKETVTNVIEKVQEIHEYFELFRKLYSGKKGDWPYDNIRDDNNVEDYDEAMLRYLRTVLNIKNISLLLAAAKLTDSKMFVKILTATSIFFFRYITVCKSSPKEVGRLFGKHANLIKRNEFNFDALLQEMHTEILKNANDTVFAEALRNQFHYQKKPSVSQKIRYFFIQIEVNQKFIKKEVAKKDRVTIKNKLYPIEKSNTVDHITPQSVTVSNADRGPLTHTIGNLSVLSNHDNSIAGDKPLLRKINYFEASNMFINQYFVNRKKSEWTAEDVIDREKLLIEWAQKVFSIPVRFPKFRPK